MATERYLCRQCKIVTEFSRKRKAHPCKFCSEDIWFPMGGPERLGERIYKGNHPYYADVLRIEDGVRECDPSAYNGSSVKEIFFPATLEKISSFCFANCNFLRKIVIPGSVKEIENYAFSNCDTLEEVILKDGVEKISDHAFTSCKNLKRIVVPGTVSEIANGMCFLCESLEEVVLGEGVETISRFAFSCCNLQAVKLPNSLRKIERAFTRLKFIRLHSGIMALDDETFKDCDESCQFVVARNSYAERYLKQKGFKYDVVSGGPGILSDTPVVDGVLYYAKAQDGRISIPSEVEIIEEYAASNHGEPTEIVLPDSVKEVKAHAFFDCKNLVSVTFGSKLVSIGALAFPGLKDQLVELPTTVKELASDAFGKGCIVSVGGEMPFYRAKCKDFEKRQKEIVAKERLIKELQSKKQALEADLDAYIKAMPQEFSDIPQYQKQIRDIEKKQAEHRKLTEEKKAAILTLIEQIKAEISSLSEQRKKCSLFALSKKKEFKIQIQRKQDELQKLFDEQKRLSDEAEAAESLLLAELTPVKRKMEELQATQKQWEKEKRNRTTAFSNITEDLQAHTRELEQQRNALEKDRHDLERAHSSWKKAKAALLERKMEQERLEREAQELLHQQQMEQKRLEDEAKALKREQRRKAALLKEKTTLLSGLIPPMRDDAIYTYEPGDAIVEERLLNEAFFKMLKAWDEECFVEEYNQFILDHSQAMDRVREINAQLELAEDDGIEHYQLLQVPEETATKLPERFVKLTDFFAKTNAWKDFKQVCKKTTHAKRSANGFFDSFFAETERICLENNSANLLLFPYCMVKYEVGNPLSIFTFQQARLTVSYQDKEDVYEKLPAYGEVLSERFMHLNRDGSVNRRYKDNPILKTIRFTSVKLSFARKSFIFPFNSYEAALQFESAFQSYQKLLLKGELCDIYKAILNSADLKDVEAKLQAYIEMETKRAAEEKYRKAAERKAARIAAKEEEKRIEAERIAAEAAAAEKRKELIQRQKERNEERKRKESEKQRIFSMFEEEPESNAPDKGTQTAVFSSPIEVVGNRAISNNVFKITVRQLSQFPAEHVTCYFVSSDGTVISNRKKIDNNAVGVESTIGFVLVSGIDYTQMRTCLMRIESNDTTIGEIDFKMNISFYSDF